MFQFFVSLLCINCQSFVIISRGRPIEYGSASVPPRSFYAGLRRGCVASIRSGFLLRPPIPFFCEAAPSRSLIIPLSFCSCFFVHDCSLNHFVKFRFSLNTFLTAFVPRICLFFHSGFPLRPFLQRFLSTFPEAELSHVS